MMPATTGAGVRDPSRTKAKLKISTTTTARKVIVASTSRLRHSMARSLTAIRNACVKKPAGRALATGAEDAGSVTGLSTGFAAGSATGSDTGLSAGLATGLATSLAAGLAAGFGLVGGAHRLGAEAAGARLVEDDAPAPQDHHLIGDRRGRQIVRHQDHHAPR